MQSLLEFAQNDSIPVWQGLILVATLFINELLRSTTLSFHWLNTSFAASRVRSAAFSIIFRKALRLRTFGSLSVGQILNLVANDAQRLFDAINFGGFLFVAIASVTISIGFALSLVGVYALAGISIFVLYFPLQTLLARFIGRLRRSAIAITDARVRKTLELIQSIRIVKMFAWEHSFAERIFRVRKREEGYLLRSGLVQSVSWSVTPMVPAIAAFITFILHSAVGEQPLSARQAFSMMAIFNVLHVCLCV